MPEQVSTFNYDGDYSYARTRLEGTICFHKGVPRYVREINNASGKCSLKPLGSKEIYIAHVNELVVNDFKLGFVNTDGPLSYVVRTPKKQYKQGIRGDVLYDTLNERWVDINLHGLPSALMGFYPSIKSAIEQYECGENNGIAFNRKFAIKGKELSGYGLMFRKALVGYLYLSDYGQVKVDLLDEKKWLEETIQEIV